VTHLRQLMLDELQRRNYSPSTARCYLHAVEDFAKYFHRSPERLGPSHIREYQVHLFRDRKLSPGTIQIRSAALRFLFVKTLRRPYLLDEIPFPKRPRKLPSVLSPEEVARLIDSARNLMHRAMLMTLYATGLRRAELCHLKVADIDSERMVIHVHQGKGSRDRDVLLTPKLLDTLREYWRWMKPKTYLFPGMVNNWRADVPITEKIVWDAVAHAAKQGRHQEAHISPHAEAQFRHTYARSRSRSADHPGAARAFQARTLDRLSAPVATPPAGDSQSTGSDRSITDRRSKALQETDEAMSRPTLEVADIVRAVGNRFLEKYKSHFAWVHRKVLDAIVRCRTAALGGHLDRCARCGHQAISFNSCRNRHCPKCQGNARAKWLAARSAELLPVSYFHVVFTLPHELSGLALQNKRLLYDLLYRTSAATMLELARRSRRLFQLPPATFPPGLGGIRQAAFRRR
jgi:integrase/recombinase XerD